MVDQVAVREVTADIHGVRRHKFSICEPVGFAIPNAADGSLVDPVIIPANARVFGIVCENTAGIAANTNISAQISFDNQDSSGIATLYEQDNPATQWLKGPIPTTGQFAFILTHAFRARRIRLILSNVTTEVVLFNIYGLDGVI